MTGSPSPHLFDPTVCGGNCTSQLSRELSHTQGLMDVSAVIEGVKRATVDAYDDARWIGRAGPGPSYLESHISAEETTK
jgi:hypothetical protein